MAEKDEGKRPGRPRRSSASASKGSGTPTGDTRSSKPDAARSRNSRARSKPKSSTSNRRPERASNKNAVKSNRPSKASWTVGGLTISVRAVASVLLFALVALILIPTGLQWAEQKREYRAVAAELEATKEQHAQLEQEVKNWSNDDYIASQARSRLGYVEKGETQFSVIDPGENYENESQVKTVAPEGPEKPWTMTLAENLMLLDNPQSEK